MEAKSFLDHYDDATTYRSRRESTDFSRPHHKHAKTPHNNQWDNTGWSPESWLEADGDVRPVIDRFYASGVIVDQYEDKVPMLIVGQPFLRLSPVDQRHVIEFVDYAFKITAAADNSTFHIALDGDEDGLLGVYSKHGLQFQ